RNCCSARASTTGSTTASSRRRGRRRPQQPSRYAGFLPIYGEVSPRATEGLPSLGMLFSNMPADPSVLAALVKALEADPDNTALRLHLAGLLIEGGAESSAMDHILKVLNGDPTNVPAIALAVKAADALGDSSRAAAYRKLLGSLQSQAEQAPAAGPPAPPPPPRAAPLPPAVDPNDPADPNEPQPEPV